jgi:hypothetical protein
MTVIDQRRHGGWLAGVRRALLVRPRVPPAGPAGDNRGMGGGHGLCCRRCLGRGVFCSLAEPAIALRYWIKRWNDDARPSPGDRSQRPVHRLHLLLRLTHPLSESAR